MSNTFRAPLPREQRGILLAHGSPIANEEISYEKPIQPTAEYRLPVTNNPFGVIWHGAGPPPPLFDKSTPWTFPQVVNHYLAAHAKQVESMPERELAIFCRQFYVWGYILCRSEPERAEILVGVRAMAELEDTAYKGINTYTSWYQRKERGCPWATVVFNGGIWPGFLNASAASAGRQVQLDPESAVRPSLGDYHHHQEWFDKKMRSEDCEQPVVLGPALDPNRPIHNRNPIFYVTGAPDGTANTKKCPKCQVSRFLGGRHNKWTTNGVVGGICQHCKEGLVCGGEEGASECCGVFKHRICFSAAQIRNARGHDTKSYATCMACVKNNQQVI